MNEIARVEGADPDPRQVAFVNGAGVELSQQQRERDSVIDPRVWEWAFYAHSRNTVKTYQYWWRRFEVWCAENRRTVMPATSATVASYAAWLTTLPGRGKADNKISPNTIDLALTAVQYAHGLKRDMEGEARVPLLDMSRARKVAAGYRKRMKNDFQWKPHEVDGLRTRHVRPMLEAFDRETVKGMRDAAALLMHRDIFGRGAEIGRIRIRDIVEFDDGVEVSIVGAKTGDRVTPVARVPWDEAMCPVAAWESWLGAMLLAGAGPDDPAFPRVPITKQFPDEWRAMCNTDWSYRLQCMAKNAGLHLRVSAHSLRYGPVEECLEDEMPYLDVKQRGGWSTDSSFSRYARRANRRVTNPMKKLALKRSSEGGGV